MKKLFFVLILVLMSFCAFAATTATLTLTGVVAPVLSISAVGVAPFSALNFAATQTNLLVGNITEISNDYLGYKVTLQSTNAGAGTQAFFKGSLAPANTATLNYTLQYNGAAVVFTAGVATVTNTVAPTAAAGTIQPLTVSYTGTFLNADTYSDTLTFTIIAK
jgi:hypothetical protein